MKVKKLSSNFVIQGSILAVAGILVRIIGLAYRIPLVRIIGDEGVGYYSTAYNVYAIMLLLSSYSLPLAVSKMISARLTKGEYINAGRILKVALLYATIVGFSGCMIVIYGSEWLANQVFHMPLSQYAMLTLAPTIWVMAYLGVLRGYFQGKSTMVPTAVSQILEQIVNAFVSVYAAWWLCAYAVESLRDEHIQKAFGAAGGTIGTGMGAITALLVLFILFILETKSRRRGIKKDETKTIEGYGRISKILFLTVVPVILSTAIYNINSILDNAIFGFVMNQLGKDAGEIAKDYGIYTARYLLLVNVPVAIANSLASSLIPTLSRAVAERNRKNIRRKIAIAIRFSMIVGIPSAVGLMVLADPIITILFGKSELAASLLHYGSIAVVLYSLSTVTNAILQGTNHMSIPVRNALFSLFIHVIALYIMLGIFKMGVYSLVYANIVFAFCMCVFNAGAIRSRLFYKQEILRTFIGPSLCAIIMGVAVYFVYRFLHHSNLGMAISMVVSVGVAVCVYSILMLRTGCISEEDLVSMPKGKSMIRFAKRCKFM